MKEIVALIAGIIAGLLVYFLGITVFKSIYPLPINIDINDPSALQAYIDTLPNKAFNIRLIVNVISIFAAGLVASIINSKYRTQVGIAAAIPFLIYFIYLDFSVNYPTYYVVLDVTLTFLIAFCAIIYGSKRVIA